MLQAEMCLVLAYEVKRMGVQSTKCLLGVEFVHAAAVCVYVLYVCVYKLSLGCGGPHGRGREILGNRPLAVKHFRGRPSKT